MRFSSRVAVGSPMARIAAAIVVILLLSMLGAGGVVIGATLLASPDPAGACAPGGGTFEAGPPVAAPRVEGQEATLSDGRMLLVGGGNGQGQAIGGADLWDPTAGVFRPTGSPTDPEPRRAVALADDRVMVIVNRHDAPAEIWDPGTEAFTPTGSLARPRGDFTATKLNDGRVLVVSGADEAFNPLSDAEIWTPATGLFEPAGTLGEGRLDHTATLLDDGRVLVVGGHDNATVNAAITTAEIWDPASSSFTWADKPMAPRTSHKAVRLPDGGVLIVGGHNGLGRAIAEAELWDPTNGFSPAGTLNAARSAGHTATLLSDGRVLIVGGFPMGFDEGDPIATAEVWDPATLSFSPAGSLLARRALHVAALQSDCSVLVIGGSGPDLDPTVERWIPGKPES
jgi:hypothetical protein